MFIHFDRLYHYSFFHGDGTFPNYTSYSSGVNPYSILSADVNNDGKIDLTVTNADGGNTINILFGSGNGTFTSEIMYSTGLYPMSLTAGAFKDKTKLDLVVANAYDNDISFFFNSCP